MYAKTSSVKRIFLLLLAALLSASALISCASTEPEEQGTAQVSASPASDEAAAEPEETTIADQIKETYAGIDYNGHELRIVGMNRGGGFYYLISDDASEIWYESQTGDVYVDAVYERNLMAEELLNVKIVPEYAGGGYADVAPFVQRLVVSGDTTIEATLGALSYNIGIAASGNLHNLHNVDSMELDQPWYDQAIVKNYSYKGNKLYAVSGAFNVFDDYAVPVVYYGKEIMTKYNLEDPAELVKEGTWTIDAMMTMGETVSADLDGDGQMTDADSYGFMDNTDILKHLLEGTGYTITRVSDDGVPFPTCLTPEFVDIAETLYNRIVASPATRTGDNATAANIFKENRGIFYYNLLGDIYTYRDMESSFSVLPLPKYNEAQANYVSAVNSIWCTSLAIPVTVVDEALERTGTILNVLSAFSVDTVDKVLYELILGSKLVRDEQTLVMLDYILNNKQYCWGNGYDWASTVQGLFSSQNNSNSFIMASEIQSKSKAIQKQFDKFIEKYENLP